MIQSFRHSGLREFWETGRSKKINAQWTLRIQVRLQTLEDAAMVEEIDVPGWRLHELKGERVGTWALKLTGNWRLTFRPEMTNSQSGESFDVYDVDLEDYH